MTTKNNSTTTRKRKGSGQPGNTNARKWTEQKLIKLGDDLLKWLEAKEKNVFFKSFLLTKGLYSDLIADQEARHPLFAERIKKAREIQELKLMSLSAFNKINVSVAIFLLKSIHGHKDRSEQVIIDETVKVRVLQPRPSATNEDNDPKIKKISDAGATVIT